MARQRLPFETHTALKRLVSENIWFTKKTDYHVKVGRYNFWPKTGTIFVDGETQRSKQRGLDAFIDMIKSDRDILLKFKYQKSIDASDKVVLIDLGTDVERAPSLPSPSLDI